MYVCMHVMTSSCHEERKDGSLIDPQASIHPSILPQQSQVLVTSGGGTLVPVDSTREYDKRCSPQKSGSLFQKIVQLLSIDLLSATIDDNNNNAIVSSSSRCSPCFDDVRR